MDPVQQEVEHIKEELTGLIVQHLQNNQIEPEKAKLLAADFLAVLPVTSWNDLLQKLKQLGKLYPEAGTIYTEELQKEEERKKNAALEAIRSHISEGKIEDAINTAKSMNNQ